MLRKKSIKSYLLIVFGVIAGVLGLALIFSSQKTETPIKTQPNIQEATPLLTESAEGPTSSPTPTPKPNPFAGKNYSIAVYGDSIVETMGEDLPYLSAALSAKYTGTTFKLYNYGIGAENAQMGLDRFGNAFVRGKRNYPSLMELKPDILIVGSFAYNPFVPHDKNKHLNIYTELINRSKSVSKKVYILAEIAPLQDGFGAGEGGVNWPENLADEHTLKIRDQLDNAMFLSNSSGVGLINAYSPSVKSNGYGRKEYVNVHDGIHPSDDGHRFMAKIIAETIKLE